MALTSQAHTVKGIRGRVIPFARKSIAVTIWRADRRRPAAARRAAETAVTATAVAEGGEPAPVRGGQLPAGIRAR